MIKIDRISELKQLIHKEMQKKSADMVKVREYMDELEEIENTVGDPKKFLEYSPKNSSVIG